jgi:hypothetical protein
MKLPQFREIFFSHRQYDFVAGIASWGNPSQVAFASYAEYFRWRRKQW